MATQCSAIIRVSGIAAALVLALAARAGADINDVNPALIRVITPTFATSDCIGRRTTPICAVESMIGCSHYLWNKTCGYKEHPVYAHLRTNKDRVEYVIVKSGFANPEKVRAVPETEWKKHPDLYEFLVDGVFQAHVLDRACPAAWPDCEGVPWQAGLYNVGPHGKPPDTWASGYVLSYHPSDWFVD